MEIPLQSFELLFKKSSSSLDETRMIAESLSALFKAGMVIGFSGDLGVGKTELIRAICEKISTSSAAGIEFKAALEVSSPTYTLENQYQLSKDICVSHWDLYRLSSLGEVGHELDELKNSANALIFIEWPSLVLDLLDLLVLISFADFERREISVYGRK